LSLPAVDPSVNRSHDAFVNAARANGPGWHLMSNIEFASVALWCWKNGFLPRGNTNYGLSSDATWETARRVDGGTPGNATGTSRTLTGSGPASWRHDNTPAGISDLCGNIWEWTPGLRIVAGEFQVIPNNNAALDATDLDPTSSAWKAIDGANGNFITPTFTGSIVGDDYVPTTSRSVRIAESGTEPYTLVRASGSSLAGVSNPGSTPVAAAALAVLKQYGLYPPVADSGLGRDGIWHNGEGERLALRGGHWRVAATGGVFALRLIDVRGNSLANLGGRPAFVI